jgi:hypothetical protein
VSISLLNILLGYLQFVTRSIYDLPS